MSYGDLDDFVAFQKRFPFARLCLPHGGIVGGLMAMPAGAELGGSPIRMFSAPLGAPHMAFPRMSPVVAEDSQLDGVGGAGSDEDVDLARVRAVAEALERYATCVLREDEYIVSSRDELGDEALDLARLPRCAQDEINGPTSYMRPLDTSQPIRWVRGVSLITGKPTYLPLIMTHLYCRAWPSERFWIQISTGVAAHTDPRQAMVSAICEVIERDAISMTWLMRLPLPRLHFDEPVPPQHLTKIRCMDRGRVRHHFFDATTDLGVPTVYVVQTAEDHPRVAQFVNCATDFSAWNAIAKLVREFAAGRTYMGQHAGEHPDDIMMFSALHHGATYMARPEQRPAFDFLLKGSASRGVSAMRVEGVDTIDEQLDFLLRRLRDKGMDAFAVDLTTDELRDEGLNVVRVVIPDLVPMSPIYTARFLDHPRLYSYPEAAGFGPRSRADVNPSPQPFA